ncbi:hypothetical protein WS51_26050 [Burkholderia territorii]|nr:hypothetical protein WS51_26050 [Burkholderia territorii]KUZ33126.1 hypothetical protein WS52_19015 [Burkholderia territorii]KUZ57985.1 hypothetical protein WS53_10985 [Burkholderia territorii]
MNTGRDFFRIIIVIVFFHARMGDIHIRYVGKMMSVYRFDEIGKERTFLFCGKIGWQFNIVKFKILSALFASSFSELINPFPDIFIMRSMENKVVTFPLY